MIDSKSWRPPIDKWWKSNIDEEIEHFSINKESFHGQYLGKIPPCFWLGIDPSKHINFVSSSVHFIAWSNAGSISKDGMQSVKFLKIHIYHFITFHSNVCFDIYINKCCVLLNFSLHNDSNLPLLSRMISCWAGNLWYLWNEAFLYATLFCGRRK